MDQEKRTINEFLQVETRGEGDKQRKVIVGSAIKYNVRSQLLGWFVEQIDERALDEADMTDVVALFNHDNNVVLGRSSSGTLTLEKRTDGLYYVIEPPKSAAHILESIERGDIRGSSFQFSIKPGGQDWEIDPESGVEVRTVKKIARLFDISVVTMPAYLQTDTEVAKRSFEQYKKEKEQVKPIVEEDNTWLIQEQERERDLKFI